MDNDIQRARILLIDDEEVNLLLLERILQKAGYSDIHSTSNPGEGLEMFDALTPDLVCTDLHMPNLTGMEIVEQIAQRTRDGDFLPIVMLTADMSAKAEQEALSLGASDFLNKPFKSVQIQLRIKNLLRTRFYQQQLRRYNEELEDIVRERTIELEAARLDLLERLALAAEYRDHTTGRHTQRVGLISALLARRLGLPEDRVELIGRAAPLHDVGKIGVPDEILLKESELTTDEFDVMKSHIQVGADLLAQGNSELIKLAELITYTHHERWDGSGYPRGLKGNQIPLVGQIVAVADVFDTLINERPYKTAWPLEKAVAEMARQSGRWFNPKVVQALFEVLAEQETLLQELEEISSGGAKIRAVESGR